KHLDVADEDDITALERLAEKDILKMIHELAPGYQAVFNLYVVEGYSHKEISELLGISEGTSKSQLARAKGILAKKVKEYLNETNK
ncbi:sigma-70 region 4 domain-containing protein, partial [Escherichia coli]|nr:sigma-70 region 4 domain-containing protein [Escherichia coli]